ncbi:hypothetical protein BDZ94DRAFT_803257 [Collybia nuda]|uniref:Uncharacterized protein n=1 Tax=Collybia nuda TaxID=64659 RepID=A0A9P5Y4U6_9AGAR|nr:hypothetical protein BDZ94DRAFT_803257 [Collybia nuda]
MIYTHSLPLTFLISSRPEPHIRHSFNVDPTLSTISRHIFLESSPGDIRTSLQSGFRKIRQQYHLYTTALIPENWPSEEDIETLVRRSSGYFIYASTVLQFINSVDVWPPDQLNLVLSGQSSPFTELDQLYHQILSMVPNSQLLVRILGYILLLAKKSQDETDYHSPVVIGSLLEVRTGDIRLTLRKMHPLLDVPVTDEAGIQVIHASFSDFLFNRGRAGKFYVDSTKFHIQIALSCLKFMRSWTAPDADRRAIKFIFHNWVIFCREATELGDQIQLIDYLQRIPDFLPDKAPQNDFRYRETKLREAVEWLLDIYNPPGNLVRLINSQRDLCYLICLSNYGSYHCLDRVLTLPLNVVFNPNEYLQERQQLSEEVDTGNLEDFFIPALEKHSVFGNRFEPRNMST